LRANYVTRLVPPEGERAAPAVDRSTAARSRSTAAAAHARATSTALPRQAVTHVPALDARSRRKAGRPVERARVASIATQRSHATPTSHRGTHAASHVSHPSRQRVARANSGNAYGHAKHADDVSAPNVPAQTVSPPTAPSANPGTPASPAASHGSDKGNPTASPGRANPAAAASGP
jgi:hypothetical protein